MRRRFPKCPGWWNDPVKYWLADLGLAAKTANRAAIDDPGEGGEPSRPEKKIREKHCHQQGEKHACNQSLSNDGESLLHDQLAQWATSAAVRQVGRPSSRLQRCEVRRSEVGETEIIENLVEVCQRHLAGSSDFNSDGVPRTVEVDHQPWIGPLTADTLLSGLPGKVEVSCQSFSLAKSHFEVGFFHCVHSIRKAVTTTNSLTSGSGSTTTSQSLLLWES